MLTFTCYFKQKVNLNSRSCQNKLLVCFLYFYQKSFLPVTLMLNFGASIYFISYLHSKFSCLDLLINTYYYFCSISCWSVILIFSFASIPVISLNNHRILLQIKSSNYKTNFICLDNHEEMLNYSV